MITHKAYWKVQGLNKSKKIFCGAKGGQALYYWKDSRSKKKVNCKSCLKLKNK